MFNQYIKKYKLGIALLLFALPFASVASNKVWVCKIENQTYMSNQPEFMPKECQNTQEIDLNKYSSEAPKNAINNENKAPEGLRAGEKQMLESIETNEHSFYNSTARRFENVDERVGSGIYGNYIDTRQDKCYFYTARVEEARADRKDDVKLNRQIARDLTQIQYYCNE